MFRRHDWKSIYYAINCTSIGIIIFCLLIPALSSFMADVFPSFWAVFRSAGPQGPLTGVTRDFSSFYFFNFSHPINCLSISLFLYCIISFLIRSIVIFVYKKICYSNIKKIAIGDVLIHIVFIAILFLKA